MNEPNYTLPLTEDEVPKALATIETEAPAPRISFRNKMIGVALIPAIGLVLLVLGLVIRASF